MVVLEWHLWPNLMAIKVAFLNSRFAYGVIRPRHVRSCKVLYCSTEVVAGHLPLPTKALHLHCLQLSLGQNQSLGPDSALRWLNATFLLAHTYRSPHCR